MQKFVKFIFISLLFSTFLVANQTITFGVYTSDKASVMYQKFKPILEYLENEAKNNGAEISIKLKIYPSYESALKGIVKGEYDFARFGPASYILAQEQNPNIKLLAMEHNKGKKVFNGVFITHKDSDIKTLKDVANKTFAFGDEQSTIGKYLAQAELLKVGIDHTKLKEYSFLQRHDRVALAVANKDFDVGVVKESTFKKYEERGLKKVATFKNVTKPWIVKEGFDEKLFFIFQNALLNLKDKDVLKVIKKSGFVKATPEDYLIIKEGMEQSKKF